MGKIKLLYLVGVVMICALLGLFSKSSFSQSSGNQSSETGRYQLVTYNSGVGSGVILVDTQTGRMWTKTAVLSADKKLEAKWLEDSPFSVSQSSR